MRRSTITHYKRAPQPLCLTILLQQQRFSINFWQEVLNQSVALFMFLCCFISVSTSFMEIIVNHNIWLSVCLSACPSDGPSWAVSGFEIVCGGGGLLSGVWLAYPAYKKTTTEVTASGCLFCKVVHDDTMEEMMGWCYHDNGCNDDGLSLFCHPSTMS